MGDAELRKLLLAWRGAANDGAALTSTRKPTGSGWGLQTIGRLVVRALGLLSVAGNAWQFTQRQDDVAKLLEERNAHGNQIAAYSRQIQYLQTAHANELNATQVTHNQHVADIKKNYTSALNKSAVKLASQAQLLASQKKALTRQEETLNYYDKVYSHVQLPQYKKDLAQQRANEKGYKERHAQRQAAKRAAAAKARERAAAEQSAAAVGHRTIGGGIIGSGLLPRRANALGAVLKRACAPRV